MSNFETIHGDNLIITKKEEILNSGYHYCLKNLTISDGASLCILPKKGEKWWVKDKKWTIIEIRNDLRLDGEIFVNDWSIPTEKDLTKFSDGLSLSVDDYFQVNNSDELKLDPIKLEFCYEFYNGGKGGNGTDGITPNVFSTCFGGRGAKGTLKYGGGGGGGVGFVEYQNRRGNEPGGDAIEYKAGAGGNGVMGHGSFSAGNGGEGGFTGDYGVGGLLVVICFGRIICDGKKIDVSGRKGVDGKEGHDSTVTPTNVILLNGAGGGGAGSSGLPGGKVYIFHRNKIEGDLNVITNGGNKGLGKHPGNAILLRPGEPYFRGEAQSGGDGKDGKNGEYVQIKI